jgi:hypothetical protein
MIAGSNHEQLERDLLSELVNLLSACPQWRHGFLQHVSVNASAAGLITRMGNGQMPVE